MGATKPPGAWTPEQTVDYMVDKVFQEGDFYVICPDNETPTVSRFWKYWQSLTKENSLWTRQESSGAWKMSCRTDLLYLGGILAVSIVVQRPPCNALIVP